MAKRRWSAAEVRALPDEPGKRFEVVDGELLVTPAPAYAHQRAVRYLLVKLQAYLEEHRAGEAIAAPADVELDPATLVQPDVFVLPRGVRPPRSFDDVGHLLLVVEVLSPSTARRDRALKRPRYQRAGTECWLVDLEGEVVERWLPNEDRPEIAIDDLLWRAPSAAVPLTIDLRDLFAKTLGEY